MKNYGNNLIEIIFEINEPSMKDEGYLGELLTKEIKQRLTYILGLTSIPWFKSSNSSKGIKDCWT